MKYLHLIWAALFRRKTRTILTLLSITMAFLLFGLLDAVRVSFAEAGQSANGAERLQTGAKLSFIQPLPKSLQQRIAQVPVRPAVDQRDARTGPVETQDQPHRGGLAGAVRAEESGDPARRHRERQVIDGGRRTVFLDKILDFDHDAPSRGNSTRIRARDARVCRRE